MTHGEIVMEEGDRDWIEKLFEAKLEAQIRPVVTEIKAVKERINSLPCDENKAKIDEHSVSITTIDTRQTNNREQAKAKHDYKDWLLKVAIAVISLLAVLNAIGFFQGLGKGK